MNDQKELNVVPHGYPKAPVKHTISTVAATAITNMLKDTPNRIIQYQYSGKEKLNIRYKAILM